MSENFSNEDMKSIGYLPKSKKLKAKKPWEPRKKGMNPLVMAFTKEKGKQRKDNGRSI